jgi:hypothetical protein
MRQLLRASRRARSVALGLLVTSPVIAAPCTVVEKAIEAGMKQSRIHAASFERLADGKPGKPALAAITIDRTHYLFDGSRSFGATPLESEQMRQMGSGLIGFSPGASCTPGAVERIAGKPAQKYTYVTDLGNGPANISLWIDRATGLPVRGETDEPDIDVDVKFGKEGDLTTVKRPTGKRNRMISGFLYGADVRAPVKGSIDAGARAALQALVNPP